MLYNAELAPHLRYDNVVHFFGFGVAGVAAWEALGARLGCRDPAPMAEGITVWLFGMGIGALNEVVEFAIALNVEESNIGSVRTADDSHPACVRPRAVVAPDAAHPEYRVRRVAER